MMVNRDVNKPGQEETDSQRNSDQHLLLNDCKNLGSFSGSSCVYSLLLFDASSTWTQPHFYSLEVCSSSSRSGNRKRKRRGKLKEDNDDTFLTWKSLLFNGLFPWFLRELTVSLTHERCTSSWHWQSVTVLQLKKSRFHWEYDESICSIEVVLLFCISCISKDNSILFRVVYTCTHDLCLDDVSHLVFVSHEIFSFASSCHLCSYQANVSSVKWSSWSQEYTNLLNHCNYYSLLCLQW